MKRHILTFICLLIALTASSKAIAQTNQMLDAELTVARNNIYLNETIQITMTIRSVGLNIGQDITLSEMPQPNQLLQIGEYMELAPKMTIVNGVEARTRQFIGDFRPLIPGALRLSPRLQLTLLTRRRSLFGTSVVQHTQHTLRVKPLQLSVMPLPKANVPADFEGAVGRFSFNADISPTTVQVGDLINITTTIKGKGYLEDVSPIGIPANSGFKTYEPKETKADPNMRTFLQTIVVTNTNTTVIPKMSFTYFDPEKSKYSTIYSAPSSIKFHKKKPTVIEKFEPILPISSESETSSQSDSAKRTVSTNPTSLNWFRKETVHAKIVSEQPLYFAPSHASLITVDIPPDAIIEILDSYDDWRKVQYKDNRGWIPQTALQKK